MEQPGPQEQHRWLERLVGRWTWETMAAPSHDEPPGKHGGTETVRSLGGLWVICEGESRMPDGGPAMTVMTLGYDPGRERFVGTFIGSMMTHLWIYEGSLAAAGRLELRVEGPSVSQPGSMTIYRDTIELLNDDERTLSSHVRSEDGSWQEFMRARYRRTD